MAEQDRLPQTAEEFQQQVANIAAGLMLHCEGDIVELERRVKALERKVEELEGQMKFT